MTVRIYDTLSGERRALEPREDARVGIYACGPTVYAPIHVGNARPFVVFSLLKRFLERDGYAVTLCINVTDINDKIYAAAAEQRKPSSELAAEMTERYIADTDRLLLGRPESEPLASEMIDPIISLIGALIESGHAYAAGGDVYFRVATFADYGKLSNRAVDEMEQGEDDRPGLKRDPHDFALWKAEKPGEDTAWDAPWGRGRPGWHIECSAMAERILGLDFEIHGGGADLIFPHHENEIAQTEAARGRPLARLWMHNGMVRFDDEKMSKSVGNIRALHAALDEYGRDALLIYFVRGHYRQPIEFSPAALDEARSAVDRVRDFCRRLGDGPPPADLDPLAGRFFDALRDDFDTPAALAALFDWVKEGNRRLDAGERFGAGPEFTRMLYCLGLERLLEADTQPPPERALQLLRDRDDARARRDWAEADRRRDELAALGFEVRDTPDGSKLVRR
jgi:cysteinyl-tRNA synthetase